MKARIEKKLSKKISEIVPKIYKDAWVDDEITELAWKQRARVSHIVSIGGELDCWGEGQDYCSVLVDFRRNYDWHRPIYNPYPEGHKWEGMPKRDKKRKTGRYLIKCANAIAKYHESRV